MKKLCMLLAGLLLVGSMSACNNSQASQETTAHTHTFEEHWFTDEENHWHAASCEHEDEVADKAAHVDEDGNDVCDVCGFRQNHKHTYAEAWTWNEATHYHKNTCGHDDAEKYRDAIAPHEDKNNDAICDVCTYDYGHTHTYAEDWTLAEGGHWHAPTCGHDVPGTELSDHVDADNNAICEGCGYDYDHTHTYAEAWSTSEDEHWHAVTCGHDVEVKDKNAHVDADGNSACDVCGYTPEHFHTFESGWTGDANGHYHKADCGHDAKRDEAPHEGYEESGVCSVCQYVVFHYYDVTVTLPDDSIKVIAPDGTNASTFTVKEGTDATFKLTMPERLLLAIAEGATIEGKAIRENGYLTYTLKVTNVKGPLTIVPDIDKTANVEVIVADGKQEMTIAKKWAKVTGELTFHAPASGRYVIYSTTHAGLSGVTFLLEGNEVEQNPNGISYEFDVAAERDVTLTYTYYPDTVPEGGKETFSYVVCKVDHELTLKTLEGEGYLMPTNANVNLTFTVPEPGLYQISSLYPVAWDDDVTSPHVFMVPEGQLTQTITMHYKKEDSPSFKFDWKIEKLGGSNPVSSGNTPVTAPLEDYYSITYTAERDGAYFFKLDNTDAALYRWYSDEYYSAMSQIGTEWTSDILKAGDEITLYIRVNIYNDQVKEDVNATLSILYVPEEGKDGYVVTPDTYNVFVHEEWQSGEYTLSVPAGAEISVDDGKTWHTSVVVTVDSYGSISYMVRTSSGASTVTVSIEKISYDRTLVLGENTMTLAPGKEYYFTLTGSTSSDYYVSYQLKWTDTAITVNYGGQDIESGATINQYNANYSTITVVYTGSAAAELTFTLIDGNAIA